MHGKGRVFLPRNAHSFADVCPSESKEGKLNLTVKPKFQVLIIGGGDGGILREVLKHEGVEHVTMCEIDEMVIDVAKKFLPHMAAQFSHPKLNLFIGDGFKFLAEHKNEFDVAITDSSDPIGPAESLFGKSYYGLLNDALRDGGVLSSQGGPPLFMPEPESLESKTLGESPWLDMKLIVGLKQLCLELFPQVLYAISSVPTYTSGSIGYLICSKSTAEVLEPHFRFLCSACCLVFNVNPSTSFFLTTRSPYQLRVFVFETTLFLAESYWLHLELISHMAGFTKSIFPTVQYASSPVSTYPSGVMGYLIACKEVGDFSCNTIVA